MEGREVQEGIKEGGREEKLKDIRGGKQRDKDILRLLLIG